MAEVKAEVKAEAILELTDEIGEVPEGLRDRILAEKDRYVLSCRNKTAAKADGIPQFCENANIFTILSLAVP